MAISQKEFTSGRNRGDIERDQKRIMTQFRAMENARREELKKLYPNNTSTQQESKAT